MKFLFFAPILIVCCVWFFFITKYLPQSDSQSRSLAFGASLIVGGFVSLVIPAIFL